MISCFCDRPGTSCLTSLAFFIQGTERLVENKPMRDYQQRFLEEHLLKLPLAGWRMLEVGATAPELHEAILQHVPEVREIIGIDQRKDWEYQGGKHRILKMDVRQLEFPDESFDLIYSLATFEHIHDLAHALQEMHRVLRPGGLLLSVWSPIWNGFNGHHQGSILSGADGVDIHLPWAHLIIPQNEFAQYLVRGESYTTAQAQAATDFIFHSPFLNRLCYGDYVQIIQKSGFQVMTLEGCRVEFGGLLHRIEEKIQAGYVSAEQVLDFFRRTPNDEVLVYKMKALLKKCATADGVPFKNDGEASGTND